MPIPVIAVFDIGKTNKKLFLFDEQYRIVFEKSSRFVETLDEDGDPCENLESLSNSILDSLRSVKTRAFDVKAVNVAAYGASFVYIDEQGKPVAPLYNYLKPYPEALRKKFYEKYGGEEKFSFTTASPVLGSLNSGMQLYRIRYQQPGLFRKIHYALHLPQYISFLLSGKPHAEITSIGCHTNLWDFAKNTYHDWVAKEDLLDKFPSIVPSTHVYETVLDGKTYKIGTGLHDSSAALIPYLASVQEPFVLISTGTWCISLNPFNTSPLTAEELNCDCLCYLQYNSKPVKASRVFAGNEYEEQVKRIGEHFHVSPFQFKNIPFNPVLVSKLENKTFSPLYSKRSRFDNRALSDFLTAESAYYQMVFDLVNQQYASTQLVLADTGVKKIFVDGGFSKNEVYMNLLAAAFPGSEVYAASMAQATALGAALAIHHQWNSQPLPSDLIGLKRY